MKQAVLGKSSRFPFYNYNLKTDTSRKETSVRMLNENEQQPLCSCSVVITDGTDS
jgi:hypothetical protein